MPQPENIDPSAYSADGGPVGALLIHGLGGSAAETRPWGEYLAAKGWTVRCPLLSGHGTTPDDLIGLSWQVWAGEVTAALEDLQRHCEAVFVGGLSMGALLALWLGADYPDIAGLVLPSPMTKVENRLLWLTPVLRYLLRYPPPGLVEEEVLGDPEAIRRLWCYDKQSMWGAAEAYLLLRQVRLSLAAIQQPVLLFQGRLDNWLSPDAAQIVYDGVASTDRALIWLEHSGHNVLIDGERESVWAQSYEWMTRVLRAAEDGAEDA